MLILLPVELSVIILSTLYILLSDNLGLSFFIIDNTFFNSVSVVFLERNLNLPFFGTKVAQSSVTIFPSTTSIVICP